MTTSAEHEMIGSATVRRVGRWSFPVYELVQDGQVLAGMGRHGWLRIFFGPGQRVELADGSRWRIKAMGVAGKICPAIFNSEKKKIAVSTLRVGMYGINGKDFGCVLYKAETLRFRRSNTWILRRHDEELGVVTVLPLSVDLTHSVHLGAVLLSMTLARYGVLGESAPRMILRWG